MVDPACPCRLGRGAVPGCGKVQPPCFLFYGSGHGKTLWDAGGRRPVTPSPFPGSAKDPIGQGGPADQPVGASAGAESQLNWGSFLNMRAGNFNFGGNKLSSGFYYVWKLIINRPSCNGGASLESISLLRTEQPPLCPGYNTIFFSRRPMESNWGQPDRSPATKPCGGAVSHTWSAGFWVGGWLPQFGECWPKSWRRWDN